ncbi:MAG: hypothetical protein ACE15D_10580 [Candidatus Eisenbacteria bacterium]
MMATLLRGKGAGKPGGGGSAIPRPWLAVPAVLGLLFGASAIAAAEPVDDEASASDHLGWVLIDTAGGTREWVVAPPEPGTPLVSDETLAVDPVQAGNAGWIGIVSDRGTEEWVVAPPPGAVPGDVTAADASLVDEEAAVSESRQDWVYLETGPGCGEWVVRPPSASGSSASLANAAGAGLRLDAVPPVVAEGERVTFSTKDNRVSSLQILVFDVTGRQVYQSADEPGGTVRWDLRDDRGAPLSKGMYFYSASGRTSAGRLQSANPGKLLILGSASN